MTAFSKKQPYLPISYTPPLTRLGIPFLFIQQDKFPITFDIKQPDIAPVVRRGSTKAFQDSVKVLRTQETLPPPSAPATSLAKSPVNQGIPATTAAAHAPIAKDKAEENQQSGFWKPVKESAVETDKMDLDEQISENTSESGEEDQPAPPGAAGSASRVSSSAHPAELEMDDDYFSDESSLVCDDLSDLETHGTSHDQQVVEVQSDSDH